MGVNEGADRVESPTHRGTWAVTVAKCSADRALDVTLAELLTK
jgi:hypothetical protein